MVDKNFNFLETNDAESPMVHFTAAKGMPARMAAAMRKYNHVEAFCLMAYACTSCLHREIIWNSRDGVTPFTLSCPTCGKPTLSHTYLAHDWCVPDHAPHWGQRVWIDMTRERADELVKRQLAHPQYTGVQFSVSRLKALRDSYYNDGHAPDLAICGYGWSPKK